MTGLQIVAMLLNSAYFFGTLHLIIKAVQTHKQLSDVYTTMDKFNLPKSFARPYCIWGCRWAIGFSLCAIIPSAKWIITAQWNTIGAVEDITWTIAELMALKSLHIFIKGGELTAKKHAERLQKINKRKNDIRTFIDIES